MTTEILLTRLDRRGARIIARGEATDDRGRGEGTVVRSPRLDGRSVLWVREDFEGFERERTEIDVLRRPLAGGPAAVLEREGRLYAQPPKDRLFELEAGGGSLFYFYAEPGSAAGSIARVAPEPAPFR